ncbi:MAG: 30S ribosomal protein S13 [Candidatus Saganbacteria bacterium]|nr:30S ribosomal protein S13 [Candidatus Saganbacteria bacterium]
MVRLVGVDLPANKNVQVALTYIFGIGSSLSQEIIAKTSIDPHQKVKDLTEADIVAIREALKGYLVEGDLRRETTISVKRLMETGTYRGSRHRKGLPARGQRTRTNARTKRGKRRTVGLGKGKVEEKKE